MIALAEITPDTTMQELLAAYPGAQRALFRKYHIGGCSSCGFSPEETLAGLCARNGNLPVNEMIAFLQTSYGEDSEMQISPADLKQRLHDGTDLRLLDIRSREEFEAVRIDGAVLLTQELMQEILARWDRQSLIIVVDHLGTRSLDASAYLAGHGFGNVKALDGGIDGWSREVDHGLARYELELAAHGSGT